MGPEKVEGVQTCPAHNAQTEVRQFLGMASYYRKFVSHFSSIAQPLRKLTEKNQLFEWTEDCQLAFETLKQRLIEPPVLHYPDAKLGIYYIEMDGSS
ncbi:MAG: hypothetical protein GY820_44365 [Gammaproteobacteria bacterium]|nr:hypothetical protein [Gammaproteobacteria bacterium]